MTLLYFPFIDIHPLIARALAGCVGPVTLLRPTAEKLPQPLQMLQDEGCITIQTPGLDAADLDGRVKALREWLSTHSRSDLAFMQALDENTPILTEPAISRLSSEIKSYGKPSSIDTSRNDALLRAGAFLQLAAEFDQRQVELEEDLDLLARREQVMFRNLRGLEADTPATQTPSIASRPAATLMTYDFGSKLTRLRLRSWGMLLRYLPAFETKTAHVLYVTSSVAVFESLLDGPAALTRLPRPYLFRPDGASGEQARARFEDWIHRMLVTTANRPKEPEAAQHAFSPEKDMMTLTLAVAPPTHPLHFFAHLSDSETSEADFFSAAPLAPPPSVIGLLRNG